MALIFVVLIGGTDAGRYITAIRAFTAAIGGAFIILWLLRAPRSADRIDLLMLGALLLFLIACDTSQFPRLSFDAATSATAFAAALFIARRAVADPATRDFATNVLGIIGLVLAVVFAVLWGLVWARWVSITGAVPPLDLILPVGPFRHFHVVGMTIAMLLPAQIVFAAREQTRWLGMGGLVASGLVIVMSGSRTIWLAVVFIGAGTLLFYALRQGGGLSRRWRRPLFLAVGVAVAIAVIMVGSAVMSRLLGTSTIELRGALWQYSLDRWMTNPLTGTGPGSFSSSLTLSGFFSLYEGVGRHADNALIQVLAEAGVLGVGSILLLALAVLVAIRHSGAGAPIAALALLAAMSVTDNPSDSAHLVVIALTWMALAAPATSVEWPDGPTWWLRVPTVLGGAVVGAVVFMQIVGAAAYDRAVAASNQGTPGQVRDALRLAVTLDPANSLYRRNLATWLLADNQPYAALDESRYAVALNDGDTTSWRVAALSADASGDSVLAARLAGHASALRALDPVNPETQAYIAGQDRAAPTRDFALVRALRWNPWAAGHPSFATNFPDADVAGLLAAARQTWISEPDKTGRQGRARSWLSAMVGDPMTSSETTAIDAAAASVIECDLAQAANQVAALPAEDALNPEGLLVRILLARAAGRPASEPLALSAFRWPTLSVMAGADLPGQSPLVDADEDARLYSRNSISAPAYGPQLPTFEGGLSAWLEKPHAAAMRGAPDSGLAHCAQ